MSLKRTFYNVGHGAFYVERHVFGSRDFTVVYDCGSGNSKTSRSINSIIDSAFSDIDTIDILFISHFHYDHINGIEYLKGKCKIKKVIIPYVSYEEKIILKLQSVINEFSINENILDDPRALFRDDTEIVIVRKHNYESNSGFNDDSYISSGFSILSIPIPLWEFIPYNYDFKNMRNKFGEKLESKGLRFSDIDSIEKMKNPSYFQKLRDIYDDLKLTDFNQTSMVLYSGKNGDSEIECNGIRIQSGCLYLGDINLKTYDVRDYFIRRLKSKFSTIGTVQISHHGQERTFDETFYKKWDWKCAIVSNSKPLSKCVKDLDNWITGQKVHLVTEHISTIITQTF